MSNDRCSNKPFNILMEKISITLAYVKRIDAKLNVLGSNFNYAGQTGIIENSLLSLIRIKTVKSLLEKENKIKTENDFEKKISSVIINFFIGVDFS